MLRRLPCAFLLLCLAGCLNEKTPNPGSEPSMTGSNSSGSGGTSASGSGGGDFAYVRMCNQVAFKEGADSTLQAKVGGKLFAATSGACFPAIGASCTAVPAGRADLVWILSKDKETSLGNVQLEAGKGYVLQFGVEKLGDKSLILPRVLDLTDVAACHRLTASESALLMNVPLTLETHVADGFAFARPAGFERKPAPAGTFTFEDNDPDALLTRFQLTSYGKQPDAQVPSAQSLLTKAFADRKLKLVGNMHVSAHYASALGDSGIDGPTRYVRMMFVRHFDMLSETFNAIAGIYGKRPWVVDLFSAEFAFSDTFAEDYYALPYLLKSIAWGLSTTPESVPLSDLKGTWSAHQGSLTNTTSLDSNGNYIGGRTSGTLFKVTLDPGGTYDLTTIYSTSCSGATTPCVVEGALVTLSKGTFALDSGVLNFRPERCDVRFWQPGKPAPSPASCGKEQIPYTLRMRRAPKGQLSFGGIGVSPLEPTDQSFLNASRDEGGPGAWDVPAVDPLTKPADDQFPAATYNACGLQEREPNDSISTATPYALNSTVTACIPTKSDFDFYEIPATAARGFGYFTMSLTDLGMAKAVVTIQESTAQSPRTIMEEPTTPGQPFSYYWTATPGAKFWLTVTSNGEITAPFKHGLTAAFHAVTDANEPNDTSATATPITVGTPIEGGFMNGPDFFTVTLASGPGTVRVENVLPGVRPSITGKGPPLAIFFFFESATAPGMSLSRSFDIPTTGTYSFELSWDRARQGLGPLPAKFNQPYRLTVSQP